MTITRQVVEGRQAQGASERVAYQLTTTPWGSSPSAPTCKLYDVTLDARTDVSSHSLSGSASAVGDVITTPLVIALTAGNLYRLEIQFVTGGNTLIAWAEIAAEA